MSFPEKPLTPRQAEYALWAGDGYTLTQIAARFCVSSKTVGNTVRRAGLDIAVLRGVCCTYCGALLRGTKRSTRYGVHYCRQTVCNTRYALARARYLGACPAVRISEATVRAVLTRKGQASERTVAREYGISRSAVNGLWRGLRRRELTRSATEGGPLA